MLSIDCPHCGPRAESEFGYGGEGGIARPAAPDTLTDAQWGDYLFFRTNPKGALHEQWCHVHGCGRWFNVLRDTATHRIHASWKIGGQAPTGATATGHAPGAGSSTSTGMPGERAATPAPAAPAGPATSPDAPFRLPAGGRIDRNRLLRFTFDGRTYTGHPGDTLASALLSHGVHRVARSFKYHRPRGILSAGAEEPSALVQLFDGARTVPNARMTQTCLVEGLSARSIHASPGLAFDLRAANGWFARLMPAGFYYKTFMASQRAWHFFERHIRAASGLGESPRRPDPDRYEKRHAHCDVLVVGAGIAGLNAALAAGASGARVVICDEDDEPGGWLLASDERVEGMHSADWAAGALQRLRAMPEVVVLPRTTAFGYHDQNFLTLLERRADHLPPERAPAFRERLWKVRARRVVLATGAHERPLVFAHNDLPGIMLAGAVATYVRRFAVLPGRDALVFTNQDAGYEAALALHAAGARVRVVDARDDPRGTRAEKARELGIECLAGRVVVEALGRARVRGARVQAIDGQGRLQGDAGDLSCDLIAVSGGFSPVVHLHAQSGGRPRWDDTLAAFVPGPAVQDEAPAGGCNGSRTLAEAARQGREAGAHAARLAGFDAPAPAGDGLRQAAHDAIRPIWQVPHPRGPTRAPKAFVDLQNDVTAADLLLALREGFESIELVKRYTAMGFGTDQGKTGNINGMGIVAQALGKSIPEVGTTTFRPNYTPVSFGAVAGVELGDAFDPVRTTPMHAWHVDAGARFEDVGAWKRPRFYPRPGEDMHAAVRREVLAVRHGVGMLDASTLGKIDVQGRDAAVLLDWAYCNDWPTLAVGRARYGLMLDENGMVFDDGVTARLGEHHYLMHTTTGGAARVLAWLERWLQTEWPRLEVSLASVTDQWATIALAGPHSRTLLGRVCADVDLDDAAFPFMSYRPGTVAGVAARLFRISFSGERGYEVNVPASHGLAVWRALALAGRDLDVTPYGTEAMHVLRAEKGFVIVGQDTDGSVTPVDLGMGAMVSQRKDFLGRRSLSRSDTARPDRKQFVGLLAQDPALVLAEGGQILDAPPATLPAPMAGHVTSSYDSPTLGRSIALALVRGGHARHGATVWVSMRDGRLAPATIASPAFYDPKGERQRAQPPGVPTVDATGAALAADGPHDAARASTHAPGATHGEVNGPAPLGGEPLRRRVGAALMATWRPTGSIIELRGDPDDAGFVAGVGRALGLPLPGPGILETAPPAPVGPGAGDDAVESTEGRPAAALATEDDPLAGHPPRVQILWTGPDRWWVLSDPATGPDTGRRLRAALDGTRHALTEVGDGHRRISLDGPAVRDVLAQGCPIDLHPRVFGPGRVAGTHFFKAGVVLWRPGAGPGFELLVRRSLAGYVRLMLGRCCAECGLDERDAPD